MYADLYNNCLTKSNFSLRQTVSIFTGSFSLIRQCLPSKCHLGLYNAMRFTFSKQQQSHICYLRIICLDNAVLVFQCTLNLTRPFRPSQDHFGFSRLFELLQYNIDLHKISKSNYNLQKALFSPLEG